MTPTKQEGKYLKKFFFSGYGYVGRFEAMTIDIEETLISTETKVDHDIT